MSSYKNIIDAHPDPSAGIISTSIFHELDIEGTDLEIMLPFKIISQPFIHKWLDRDKYVWMFGIPVTCYIHHLDSDQRFKIVLIHGQFEWEVRRTLWDFIQLNLKLGAHKFKKKILNRDMSAQLPSLPPNRLMILNINKRATKYSDMLERYLNEILRCAELKNNPYVLRFCNVSFMSFKPEFGIVKGRESDCFKRPGGYYGFKIRNTLAYLLLGWQYRYLIQKGTFMAYVNIMKSRIGGVILLDEQLSINIPKHNELILTNRTRIFKLKFPINELVEDWSKSIIENSVNCRISNPNLNNRVLITGDVDNSYSGNILAKNRQMNRFDSFAPIRYNEYGYWFVDGSGYFSAVADALYSAKREIFIGDWWLSPKLYLKRPLNKESNKWRLDNILKNKAQQGVNIYVLIYKEIPFAIGLNSEYTEKILNDLHPYNIHVLRHPDHLVSGVLLWSHHEKLVCVDQRIAFLGGLDICYGRWDDQIHRLTDIAPRILMTERAGITTEEKPDYSDIINPDAIIKERKIPRLPQKLKFKNFVKLRKTIQIKDKLLDPIKKIFKVNEFNYNLASSIKTMEVSQAIFRSKTRVGPEENIELTSRVFSNIPLNDRKKYGKADIEELDLVGSGKYWIGKDYSNIIYKDIIQVEEPFTDLIDRNVIPRLPWHDISAVVFGLPARDVSRHFIERWNQTVVEKRLKDNIPLLLPYDCQELSKKLIPDSLKKILAELSEIQICRSCTTWSGGIKDTEKSIHDAYLDVIRNAKRYIYIENQFFISNHGTRNVVNQVANAIYERIVRAYELNEQFKVYIVLPLLPGFQGEVGEKTGTFIKALIYWTNATLCHGPGSLIQRLNMKVLDSEKYISIFGLRKYAVLDERLVTELVYMHSKLIIVDDQAAIIGSANINDRSLNGDRDSEIAAMFRDKIEFKGKKSTNDFCGNLRKSIFNEHLFGTPLDSDSGIRDERQDYIMNLDPSNEDMYQFWLNRSQKNTDIYDEVFKCLPPMGVRSLESLRIYKNKNLHPLSDYNRDLAISLLGGIRGRIVKFPLDFLVDEGENLLQIPKIGLFLPRGDDSLLNTIYT